MLKHYQPLVSLCESVLDAGMVVFRLCMPMPHVKGLNILNVIIMMDITA